MLEKNTLTKISDKEYFSIGNNSYFDNDKLVTSASFFKMVYDRDLYDALLKGFKKPDEKLQYIFDVGSAFHCYILEPDEFDKRYYISDKNNSYDKERKNIKIVDMEFIKAVKKEIELKYPYILKEVNYNEVALLTEIQGVPYKCKFDKIVMNGNIIEIIDLKSVFFNFYSKKYSRAKDGIRWGLIKEIVAQHYDLQGYLYKTALEEYINSAKIDATVVFKLLLASKETNSVKMVEFGSDTLDSGERKFNTIFREIQAFYHHGRVQVEKSEII